mmetsp:Transcript_8553/g.14482  ORF Transcript_8553/g.14482 Transcript_8553/m.14482 type:complete len:97 (-) Transcript_8553:308-598(-)
MTGGNVYLEQTKLQVIRNRPLSMEDIDRNFGSSNGDTVVASRRPTTDNSNNSNNNNNKPRTHPGAHRNPGPRHHQGRGRSGRGGGRGRGGRTLKNY